MAGSRRLPSFGSLDASTDRRLGEGVVVLEGGVDGLWDCATELGLHGVCGCCPRGDAAPRLSGLSRGRSSARRCSLCAPSTGFCQKDREAEASVDDAAPPAAERRVMNEGSLRDGRRERRAADEGSSTIAAWTVWAMLKESARDEGEHGDGDGDGDGSSAMGSRVAAAASLPIEQCESPRWVRSTKPTLTL